MWARPIFETIQDRTWSLPKYAFKKLPVKLPPHALTDTELKKYVKILKIPYFRGVFMRDGLPKQIRRTECGIINLDENVGRGTHWTAYIKNNYTVKYFDSMGNLKPPVELVNYFNTDFVKDIEYNSLRYQKLNSFNCGHLCLMFLYMSTRQNSPQLSR